MEQRGADALSSSKPPTRSRFFEWGRAVLLPIGGVGTALFVTQSLQNPVFPTPLFFASIVISTWFGGLASGLLAVTLAITGLNYYFIAPVGSFALNKPQMLYLAEFALPALLTCMFIRRRRRTETELESLVAERTAALRLTNEQLLGEISERVRAEEIAQKTQSELAHVTRVLTLGELGVSIAHEVNQPLNAVMLNGDACLRWLASDPPRLDEARSAVNRMIDGSHRAGEIVRRIRDISRKSNPERIDLDLNQLVTDVLALADRECARAGVEPELALATGLPWVRADRVQLQQVVLNLVMNALEAMPNQPRQLRLRTLSGDDGSVTLRVEDSGQGLPAGDPEQLFSAFFTTKQNGLGMGLAISRTIIEAHGGQLWATPGPEGATFQFRLPGRKATA